MNDNAICGAVIQHARDIQELNDSFDVQEVINNVTDRRIRNVAFAGICNSIGALLLTGVCWMMGNLYEKMNKRIDKLEKAEE